MSNCALFVIQSELAVLAASFLLGAWSMQCLDAQLHEQVVLFCCSK